MKHTRVEPLEARIAPATLIGLNESNQLISFDSASPGTIASTTDVTGLGAGESLIGIDFRPATGLLYGVTIDSANVGRIYAIDPATGQAAFSAEMFADPGDGSAPYTSLSGANFGLDFNPVPDRLRIVSDTNQNLRINVDTGATITDGDINPTGSTLAGAGYINSFAGTTSTALFDIDVANDRLVSQSPPNDGTLVAVGAGLGIGDITGVGGFDVATARAANGTATHTAYGAFTVGGVTGLYDVNLTSGAATSLGTIGSGTGVLRGLTASIGTPSAIAFTVDAANHLLRFDTATPGLTTDRGLITGLGVGESIVGFDFRPANGLLYAVTQDLASVGRIYSVNTTTAAATLVSTLAADPSDLTNPYTTLSGTGFGVDFNPVPDRLRIVSDTGLNLRINVDTGLVLTDGALNGPGTPGITAAAYLNPFIGTTTTSLFDIDPITDQLLLQNPPNNGELSVIGALGVDASAVAGFDIRSNGEAFATLTGAGTTSLYNINLSTGAATLIGPVGTGGALGGLAIANSGSLQFNPPGTATVDEADGVATLTVTRLGGTEGVVSVIVETFNGNATGGSDYTPIRQILTFGPADATKSFDVEIAQDLLIEGSEVFSAVLTPAGGIGRVDPNNNDVIVTIADDEPAGVPARFIGLDNNNNLLGFTSGDPASVNSTTPVTGLGAGETLIGIDHRPANGGLYGVTIDSGNVGRVYLINPNTGVATFSAQLVADPTDVSAPYVGLGGANFGLDFNPVPDRLRIVSDLGQNLRINVDNGFVITDGDLNPGGSILSGAAYTNAFAGTTTTALYDLDIAGDRLVLQNPPNGGTLVEVGSFGVDAGGVGGFDIFAARAANGTVTNTGYAALTVGGVTGIYQVDLGTGAVSLVGSIGSGTTELRGLTVPLGDPSATAYSIGTTNELVRFNTDTPNLTTAVGTVTGLGAGETIIGFDFRPANGLLYAVTRDAGNVGRIYTISTTTAAATLVSTLTADAADPSSPYTSLSGVSFGTDFNPVPDRLRIVSDSGQNLRINVDTGAVTTDGDLNGPGTPGISGAAYTNAFAGTSTTALYDIDPVTDQLLLQNPPNNGTLVVVGSGLGVDATAVGGFDIRANGEAFATLTVGGITGLYAIDLTAGTATLVGEVGAGVGSRGLTLATSGALQFASATTTIAENGGSAILTINRIGGSEGTVSVVVNTASGTATSGSDFTEFSRVVTFGPGVTTQNITIPIFDDSESESIESFTVTLSDPVGGASINALNPLTTNTVTIEDNDALSGTGKSVTFTDVDGDIVTIKVTKGSLTGDNFTFIPVGDAGGFQLAQIDLTDPQFANANLTITAKRGPGGGDGFVNVGSISALGTTFGKIAINGDLGQIDAFTAKSITVQSLGRFGLDTQSPGGTLVSNFNGGLGKLVVKSDVVEASVRTTANIASVRIGGSLVGGADDYSGSIEALGRIGSLTVTGSIVGGTGLGSGSVIAETAGAIKVAGDLDGASLLLSGLGLPSNQKQAVALKSLTVGGKVADSSIFAGYDRDFEPLNPDVATGAIKVKGDWIASDLVAGVAAGADSIFGTADDIAAVGTELIARIAKIAIGGQILGTLDSSTDGYGFAAEQIGSFTTGKTKFPLTSGADSFAVGATGDVNIRETVAV